jgi:SAM-dependent methyltransferase
MKSAEIKRLLRELVEEYPAEFRASHLLEVDRMAYGMQLAFGSSSPDRLDICDVGGGASLFAVGCKAAGCRRSVLVDDFGDRESDYRIVFSEGPHARRGVVIVSRDVMAEGLGVDGPFDVVTSFDSMEHWGNSPKALFGEIVEKLRPGGRFVLGVPNCVNLRKRITVPFGYGKWTSFDDWYGAPVFRGHVREPDVDDLRAIAADLGLTIVGVTGRNWLGYYSRSALMRTATTIADAPLRAFPTLCSNIYLVAEKPAARTSGVRRESRAA